MSRNAYISKVCIWSEHKVGKQQRIQIYPLQFIYVKMYLNTITANMCTLENKDNPTNLRKKAKRKRKHIPHAQRPSEYVEKRNKRERNRIRTVNEAFEELRKKVPSCGQDPDLRISKMEVLTHAIGYIEDLCGCLGYGNFAEYWFHEGQFTRVKENTGSGLQVNNSALHHLINLIWLINQFNSMKCLSVRDPSLRLIIVLPNLYMQPFTIGKTFYICKSFRIRFVFCHTYLNILLWKFNFKSWILSNRVDLLS